MTSKWTNVAVSLAAAMRSWTGIYRFFLCVGLISLVVGSFIAGDLDVDVPIGLYMPILRLFCQPERRLALSLNGALVPIVASVVLIGILLPGKSDVLGLVLTTLMVTLVAYLFSNVDLDLGIAASGGFLGFTSGLLAQLIIIARIALGTTVNHVELNLAIRSLGPPIPAFLFRPIVTGYFAAVFGTLIGADIFRLCSLMKGDEVVRIGGAGMVDAIFLAGILSPLIAVGAWLLAWRWFLQDNRTIGPTRGSDSC